MLVLQEWTEKLTLMQQTVLISAVRGPDNGEECVKPLLRWYRRCVLRIAFLEGNTLDGPWLEGGGKFTGPVPKKMSLQELSARFTDNLDKLPLHFVHHLAQAAEVLAYSHPYQDIADFWLGVYSTYCRKMNVNQESVYQMRRRLSDDEQMWRDSQ